MSGREPKPTLGHRLEAAAVWTVTFLIRILPERMALSMGSGLGWFAGVVLRIRHQVVRENLQRAFPEASATWTSRVAARSWAHLGREGVALLRLSSLGPREVWERTEVEGLEEMRAALDEGRGLLILAGHYGNWEIGGAAVAVREIPLDVVARRQSNPLFDRRLRRTREGLGMRVIYRSEGVRPILRALREDRGVALVADQNVREGGLFVDFFGTPAATTRGPATLARRTGAPVFLASVRSLRGPRARHRLTLRPVEPPDPEGGEEGDRAFLRRYLARLEADIREDPTQYFWPHKRWKTRPDDPEISPDDPERDRAGTDPSQEPSAGSTGT